MKTIYLDTNIWGNISDGKILTPEVNTLQQLVESKKVRCIMTEAIMEEIAKRGITSTEGCKKAFEWTRRLCANQGVKPQDQILNEEITAMVKGKPLPSIFMGSNSQDDVKFKEVWTRLAVGVPKRELRDFYDKKAVDSERNVDIRRDAVEETWKKAKERLGINLNPNQLSFSRWRKSQYSQGGTLRHAMRVPLKQAGCPASKVGFCLENLNKAPALRMYIEFLHIAQPYVQIVRHERIRESDPQDGVHAIYASKIHVFVTNDNALLNTLKLIPNKRCKCYDWSNFYRLASALIR